MLYLFNIQKKKIVIHISSKCGSSSVLYLFLINSQLNLTTKEKEMFKKNPSMLHKYCNKHYLINSIPNDKNLIKLKFVRNPFYRTISSFFHLSNENLSFISFLEKLESFTKDGSNQNILCPGPTFKSHYLPQYLKNEKFDIVLKIEDLKKSINDINTNFNLNLKTCNLKLNTRNTMLVNNINYNYINNPLGLYKNHKPSNYELFLNKKTRKIIYSIYKKDIITYNY